MQRLKEETGESLAVWTAGSPETSVIFNNPDRRVALTTPAVLITPDITTSSFGSGEEGGGRQQLLAGVLDRRSRESVTSSGSSGGDTVTHIRSFFKGVNQGSKGLLRNVIQLLQETLWHFQLSNLLILIWSKTSCVIWIDKTSLRFLSRLKLHQSVFSC